MSASPKSVRQWLALVLFVPCAVGCLAGWIIFVQQVFRGADSVPIAAAGVLPLVPMVIDLYSYWRTGRSRFGARDTQRPTAA